MGFLGTDKIKNKYRKFLEGNHPFPNDLINKSSGDHSQENSTTLSILYTCIADKDYAGNVYRLVYDMITHPEKEQKYGLYQYRHNPHKRRYFYNPESTEKERCMRTKKEKEAFFFSQIFSFKIDYDIIKIPLILDHYRYRLAGNAYPNNFFGSKQCKDCYQWAYDCSYNAYYRAIIILLAYYWSDKGTKIRDLIKEYLNNIQDDNIKEVCDRQFNTELYHAKVYGIRSMVYNGYGLDKIAKDMVEECPKMKTLCTKFKIKEDALSYLLDYDFEVLLSKFSL